MFSYPVGGQVLIFSGVLIFSNAPVFQEFQYGTVQEVYYHHTHIHTHTNTHLLNTPTSLNREVGPLALQFTYFPLLSFNVWRGS